MIALAVATMCAITHPYGMPEVGSHGVVEDRVDWIEINHVYSDTGKRTLVQVIFWDWDRVLNRRVCVDWRLWKDPSISPTMTPAGEWQLMWQDGEHLRRVICKAKPYTTWTQYDPELWDRHQKPKNERRKLIKPKVEGSSEVTE